MKTTSLASLAWLRNSIALHLVLVIGLLGAVTAFAGNVIGIVVGGSSIAVSVSVPEVRSIRLRVAGPGDFFIEERTDEGYLSWSAPSDLVDGEYRYEVFAATGSQAGEQDDYRLYGERGRFDVRGGIFINSHDPLESGASNTTSTEPSLLAELLLRALKWMIPAASAVDLYATSGSPTVYFDDTGSPATSTDWGILGNDDHFGVIDYVGVSRFVTDFNAAATTTALRQNSQNDLFFAGDQFFIDYNPSNSWPAVGIGTITPAAPLHIVHPAPAVMLDNSTQLWTVVGGQKFSINSWADPMLTVDVTGNVGIGTYSPGDKVDVRGSIRAEVTGSNSLGDGLTKAFRMNALNLDTSKSSDVGFELSNAKVGFSWAFRTFEGPQGFAATKQGSGGSEFTIENPTSNYTNVVLRLGSGATNTNGQWINASSRAYKDNIRDLSAADAIQALEALNPVTYTFKNDASKDLNVGFIAEDTPDLVATPDRKGLNPLEVVAMLTKVVKEQQKTLHEQEQAMADYRQALQAQQEAMQKQQEMLDTLLRERTAASQSEAITTSMLVQ